MRVKLLRGLGYLHELWRCLDNPLPQRFRRARQERHGGRHDGHIIHGAQAGVPQPLENVGRNAHRVHQLVKRVPRLEDGRAFFPEVVSFLERVERARSRADNGPCRTESFPNALEA